MNIVFTWFFYNFFYFLLIYLFFLFALICCSSRLNFEVRSIATALFRTDMDFCNAYFFIKEGFMKPSYRLVSVISHLGHTSESGEYFEFISITSWSAYLTFL